MSTILIVDDEEDLATTVAYAFEQEGWTATVAHDGKTALESALGTKTPDVVLLDLMLPDISGTEVCRQLRSHDATRAIPIVMLTARNEEIDRVVGFEVGADDYVGKPFSMRELVLRIKAILRRAEPPETSDDVRFGRLRVDHAAHQVWIDEEEIVLTALEFRLLWTLLSRRGRVQSRETLLNDVWGHDPGTADAYRRHAHPAPAQEAGSRERVHRDAPRCRVPLPQRAGRELSGSTDSRAPRG